MQRTIRLRPYAIAIILMGLVFAALNYFLVYFVRGIFLRRLEEESLNYASIYRLVKSREAYRAINDLLEQRLLTATSTAALFSDQMSDKALQALAHFLSGDEIYLYSPDGVIEYSTRPEYLGWQAPPGHPVHDFMVSGLESLEEDIRRDSESVAITNTPTCAWRMGVLSSGASAPISFTASASPAGAGGDHRPGRFRHRLFGPFPHWGAPHRLHQDRQGLHRQHDLQGQAPPDHQGPHLHVPQAGSQGCGGGGGAGDPAP